MPKNRITSYNVCYTKLLRGGLTQVRVGDLAKEALDAMGGTMRDGLFPAVACLQFSIAPGEVERNIDQVRAMLAAKPPAPGTLVLLPEIWATGFDRNNFV